MPGSTERAALWNKVNKPFVDNAVPSNYAPFNVQAVGGKIYVTYAKVGADMEEEKGPGLGMVDIYNPNGSLVKRFVIAWRAKCSVGGYCCSCFVFDYINEWRSRRLYISQPVAGSSSVGILSSIRLSSVPILLEAAFSTAFSSPFA
ncbi:MAG: hypothetical protein ACTHM5_15640 [Ginsengibacter sp.]